MELKISMKAARINAGMTLKEAAKQIGVGHQTLFNWEHGKTHPSFENARKLAEVYNFPLDNIFIQ